MEMYYGTIRRPASVVLAALLSWRYIRLLYRGLRIIFKYLASSRDRNPARMSGLSNARSTTPLIVLRIVARTRVLYARRERLRGTLIYDSKRL